MNKTAIKNFAVWARNKLIADITYRAGLVGVGENGIAEPLPQSSRDLQFFDIGTKDYAQAVGKEVEQRKALINAIQEKECDGDYASAFQAVVHEVAYTWFNRLIAIRFMEVNDYLPSRVRVLSSENQAKNEPDFVTTPFETDMEFTSDEQDTVMRMKEENKLDDLFRMLFIKQCNKLHEILPELFENTNDYTELLLSISFTDSDGIIYHLVHDIDEDDFNVEKEGQVEIIGWLYQYYNTEPKDETFALLRKNVKITKERIPAATQLFTPDWIVRYMVENSLGRLWVEGHPNDKANFTEGEGEDGLGRELKSNWKYYLEEAEQKPDVQAELEKIRAEYRSLNPEDIKVIDPCMGSGHILVYCFDVLMQIYESQGYTQRDAAQSILKNNLFGLDIDKRAAQLSYFAVMMKARQYDRRIFGRGVEPHVYAIRESNGIAPFVLDYFCNGNAELERAMNSLMDDLYDAKEYGSILHVAQVDFAALYSRFEEIRDDIHLGRQGALKELLPLVQCGEAMAQKYHVVVTNPPYMGASNMNAKLSSFIKNHYAEYKSDFFSAFVVRCCNMALQNGKLGFLTPYVWMFIQSYEKMRRYLFSQKTIETLIQFEYSAFEEATVPICTFAISNYCMDHKKGVYIRLTDFRGGMEVQRKKMREAITGKECKYLYTAAQCEFGKIPGSPAAYWLPITFINSFGNVCLENIALAKSGMTTTDNNRFLRLWHENLFSKIGFDYHSIEETSDLKYKWFPFSKGGDFRRWYGNLEYTVNWYSNGREIRKAAEGATGGRLVNVDIAMKECLVWTKISSSKSSFRYKPKGVFFSDAAPGVFFKQEDREVLLGLLNSSCTQYALDAINPTLNYVPGAISAIPVVDVNGHRDKIKMLVWENVNISRIDWDSFETSWDFARHPMLRSVSTVSEAYAAWQCECEERFFQLKANEEELNRIFIDIYGLQEELIPEVEDRDVTVRRFFESKGDIPESMKGSNYALTKADAVKGLISYAVGCMFGRYSLDVDGLAYAGGEWCGSKYSTFIPDKDNCIPITDEPYFEDDAVGLFCAWLKKVYGEETLEENLDFIAETLGTKGSTSREVIRNYFLTGFIKDHNKTYQKRPIYWLFDSGKQNGFKALVYMHRWDADTVGYLRIEYLHKTQRIYEREIQRMQETMDNSHDSREINRAGKCKEKLQKQLKETKDYDTKLAHIALSRIDIDLDDGVKANYEKVQTGRDGMKMQILAKI
ncbi:MAG: BREX-1 system adenine-specific DNA-methyltransferase PglX [Eubacteriales bacterium]|nr:BREX-1 system adenine-specific DNA-methyltransferase PglX [Eubacteriales bacterium]